jgi:pimeloyl-ACP methyl ester carboxylesterase
MSRLFPEVEGQTVVTADGARLFVERAASPGGSDTPLLFLHGGMGTLDDWAPLARQLGRGNFIAMDSRGHGASTLGREPLSYAQLQADVVTVLDQLEVPRVVIVGFSDGGIVGYRLALYARERIERLVTIGGASRLSDAARPLMQKVTAGSWDVKFPQTRRRYDELNPEPDFERFIDASRAMWLDESRATGYPGDDARAIRQPTLIVRGDRDHLFSLDEAVDLRRSIKDSSLLHVPFAAHDPSAQVEIVVAGIRAFLSAANSGTS